MKHLFVLATMVFLVLTGCETEATPTVASSPSIDASTAAPIPADLTKALFTLQDMPSDWEQRPKDMLGDVRSNWLIEDFTPNHSSVFEHNREFQTIIGLTGWLDTESEQTGFDMHLAEPEALLQQMANYLIIPARVSDYQEKPELGDIGDVSAGWSATLDPPDPDFGDTMDVVAFRRGSLGAIVSIQYLLDTSPKADIGNIAQSLDKRVQALATQTTVFASITKPPVTDLPGNPTLGDALIRPIDKMVMVYVPGGAFLMGSDENDSVVSSSKEFPQHVVTLGSFWIDQTEVTNAQYILCVEAGECERFRTFSATRNEYYGNSEFGDYPVVGPSWKQAQNYCQWAGGRLPTEAEWEYAARGPDSLTYPWGNSPSNETLLNYDDNVGDTTRVGSYPQGASWCGALDMAGNVWEWVFDWFNDYSSEPQTDPTGPSDGEWKLNRGGSFRTGAGGVHSASRTFGRSPDGDNREDFGFRCVWLP